MWTNKQNVKSMNKCKKRCSRDPQCYAFHYYLLDPWGITNCWIWKKDTYQANGTERAYCFVKTGDAVTDSDELDAGDETNLSVSLDKDRKVPGKSMNDWDKEYE